MVKRANRALDEMRLATALIYFVFVGAIAVIATIASHVL